MQKNKLLTILILAACCGVILFFYDQHENNLNDFSPKASPKKTLEFFSKGIHSQNYRKNGSLEYDLKSSSIQHFNGSNTSHVTQPNIIIYTEHHTPWHLSAHNATIQHGKDKILLAGNVQIKQKEQRITMNTEQLTILPQNKILESQEKVMITTPSGSTSSTGVRLNFNQQRIFFLTQVHSTYFNTPPNKQEQ